MIISLHLSFVLFNLFISSYCIDELLFINPRKEYFQINENITISCRTKILNYKDFLFKRYGKIFVYKCKSFELNYKVSCGHVREWYYMNVTLPSASWQQRGQYQCIINQQSKTVYVNISVLPRVEMSVTQVSYKSTAEKKRGSNIELRGTGQSTKPYDLRNLNIKSIELTCSSNCSFPAPTYLWQITKHVTTLNTNTVSLSSMNADNITCTDKASEGMSRSSSLVTLDCFEQQLTGIQVVECRAMTNNPATHVVRRAYVLCTDGEYVTKFNGSRLIAKNQQWRVTTGEMINIVVGCSIGVILLISGIIMICKHRSKDELGPYTMRQNSIDHSGYRV